MTLSMNEMIKLISTSYKKLTPNDIDFILTVIRDNCLNDETYEYINKILEVCKL